MALMLVAAARRVKSVKRNFIFVVCFCVDGCEGFDVNYSFDSIRISRIMGGSVGVLGCWSGGGFADQLRWDIYEVIVDRLLK